MAVGRCSIPNGNSNNNNNINLFTKELDGETIATDQQIPPVELFPFIRIPIIIVCTIIVMVLFIAGTATTAISYPPKPPQWKSTTSEGMVAQGTALDGDFKLLGPLLLTAGCFLLIVDVALCAVVTREAYNVSRAIRPYHGDVITARPVPLAVAGGPFYIVTADPAMTQPFNMSRARWGQSSVVPNAPTPDFSIDGGSLKGSRPRAATATLSRGRQPAFNPNIEVPTANT